MSHEDDDRCPDSPTQTHEPDWSSCSVTHDGGEAYIDVNCKLCGRSGCVGTSKNLIDGINW